LYVTEQTPRGFIDTVDSLEFTNGVDGIVSPIRQEARNRRVTCDFYTIPSRRYPCITDLKFVSAGAIPDLSGNFQAPNSLVSYF
jgi:hypothetical protein